MRRILHLAACAAHAALVASAAHAVVYNVPPDAVPATLNSGDILNYDPGADLFDMLSAPAGTTVNLFSGFVDFPAPVEGTLNLLGGNVSTPLYANDAIVNLGPGSTLSDVAIQRSVLNIAGGRVVFELHAIDSTVNLESGEVTLLGSSIAGSTINMAGGLIAGTLFPFPIRGNGTLNVMGGVVGGLRLGNGVDFNLSGGKVGFEPGKSFFTAEPGSTVHLFVQNAAVNGAAIAGLSPGTTVPLDVTNLLGELTGVLRDGSPFHFDLAQTPNTGNFPSDPTIVTNPSFGSPSPPLSKIEVLITLVPEPTAAWLTAAFMSCSIARLRPKSTAFAASHKRA